MDKGEKSGRFRFGLERHPSLVQPSACLRVCGCTRTRYNTGRACNAERSSSACPEGIGQHSDKSKRWRLHRLGPSSRYLRQAGSKGQIGASTSSQLWIPNMKASRHHIMHHNGMHGQRREKRQLPFWIGKASKFSAALSMSPDVQRLQRRTGLHPGRSILLALSASANILAKASAGDCTG